ncbi:MAG TPA: glycosyltransferase [Caldithrix abyssi]|uniref:Glycosyltransferase n=1 Tax=Caldithrix abyssi TaxID=187145 RepID=A0A7V4TZW1_CALAY|nr:glycosyltransferase [Caldithrix abyssi]
MRIGMISSYPPIECGIATYTQYLTEALRRLQNDVYIVSHVGGAGKQVFPSFDYDDGDLAHKAFSAMIRFTPDVVHIQHEFGLFGKYHGVAVVPLILQFRLSGTPVVTTLHTVYKNPDETHRLLLESILLHSNTIIVHEDYQKDTLLKLSPIEAGHKIHVIEHGAREVEPVARAREKLNLPRDKKIILMIGYFRPSKNFELIIDLFPQILAKYPEAVLVLAGKIRGNEHLEYRTQLFNRIEHSPVKDHIYLIRGQLKQDVFDTILSAADVVVLPYKINSQSGILAHSLAFGRPIVASDSGAMKRIMQRSGAGFVCENDDEFVANIVKVLSDSRLAQALSTNARKYVKEHIGWSGTAQKHLAIYRQLMDKPILESRTIWVE